MSESAIRLIAAVAALIIMSIGLAHAQTVQRVEIYEFGAYNVPSGIDVGPSRQGIMNFEVSGIELSEATQTVLARVGNNFGFRFRVIGSPSDVPVAITIVMRFPKPGISVPGNPRHFVTDDFTFVRPMNREHYYAWCFDNPDKMVPGIWAFEVWIGGKKYAEQKFNVILPPIAEISNGKEAGA